MSKEPDSVFDKLKESIPLWISALLVIVAALAFPLTKWNSAALVVPLREEYLISSADGKIERAKPIKEYALFSLYRNTAGLVGKDVGLQGVVAREMLDARLFSDSSTLVPDTGFAFGENFRSSTRWDGLNLGARGSTAVMVIGQPIDATPTLWIEQKGPPGVINPDHVGKVYVYTTVEVWGLLLIGVVCGVVVRNFFVPVWDLFKRAGTVSSETERLS